MSSKDTQHDEPMLDSDEATLEPTPAEIEAWAAQERQRREAWLRGPTEEQKTAWARRERERRLFERGDVPGRSERNPSDVAQRYVREVQLAAEGAMSAMLNLSLSEMFDQLVEAGRQWEDEFTSQPRRRPRRLMLGAERPEGHDADASEGHPQSS
jgi:hypothetical protein